MNYRDQIFTLAMSLINVPLDEIDTKIQQSLKKTAEYFCVDRAYVFDYNFCAGTVSKTYEWCAPGITEEITNLQNVPMSLVSEWINAHIYGEPIHVPDVSLIPSQELQEHIAEQQIKSLITLPLMDKNTCVGCVGFDSVLQHRHFGFEEIELLGLFAGLLVDLKLRANQENKLREKERRLRAVIDGTQAGTWEWNVQTGKTVFNERWAEMIGFHLSELEPTNIKTWQDLVHPEDLASAEKLLQLHFSGETNFYLCEMRMRHKQGHWVWIQDTGRIYEWTEKGLPLLMAGTHQDISWRKDLQTSLEDQYEINKLLFDKSLEAVYLHDLDGNILNVNEAACVQTQLKWEDLIGMTIFDLDQGPSSQKNILNAIRSMKIGEIVELETMHHRANGYIFPVELKVNKIFYNSRPLILAHARDVSRQKQAEDKLRKKEEFYRSALDSIPGIIYVSKPDGNDEYVNQFAQCYMNASSKELLNNGWLEMVHPEDRERIFNAWQKAIKTGHSFSEEYRLRRYDDRYEWFRSSATPIKNEFGKIQRFFGIALCVEAMKQATATIAKREALLDTIIENINESVLMLDRDHRLVHINRAGLNTIGASLGQSDLTLEDVIGKSAKDFFPDANFADKLMSADEYSMQTGTPGVDEHVVMSPKGLRTILINRLPLRDHEGQISGLVIITHDITTIKQQEKQRFDSLERQRDILVREVHHRIKNHLQGVLGLIHNTATDQPNLALTMQPIIRQVKSIADVYGMISVNGRTEITISELIENISSSYPEQERFELSVDTASPSLTLNIENAVPTSLIINELLNNAIKHRQMDSSPGSVKINVASVKGFVLVKITSGPAYLPPGFDIDDLNCLGTGLELVKSLMPSQDSRLEFEQRGDEVVVTYSFMVTAIAAITENTI